MAKWTVPRLWDGATVACIGSGPSLTSFQTQYCRRRFDRVIAVNNAIELVPDADVLYAGDEQWWRWYHERPEVRAFTGIKVGCVDGVSKYGAHVIYARVGLVWSTDPTVLGHGKSGGYQAINLAALLGAQRVVLVGYDYQVTGARQHFFGDHRLPGKLERWAQFAAMFDAMAQEATVEIVNATPKSAVTAFPQVLLYEL